MRGRRRSGFMHVAVKSPEENGGRPVMAAMSAVIHPVVTEAVRTYNRLSGLPLQMDWGDAPVELDPYLKLIYGALEQDYTISNDNATPYGQLIDNKTVWVAFSAGKDSIAVTLRLLERGYRPVLYHVNGINRSWPDEMLYARTIANLLGLPFVLDRVKIVGSRRTIIGCPARNQVVLLMMLGRMLAHGGNQYAFGTLDEDTTESGNPLVDFTDGTGPMETFHNYLTKRFPGLVRHQLMRNELDSTWMVAKHGLIRYSHSCINPMRFRNMFRERTEKRFGVKLLPGRCGMCFKCCLESIAHHYIGVRPLDSKFLEYNISRVPTFDRSEVADDEQVRECYQHPDFWPIKPYLPWKTPEIVLDPTRFPVGTTYEMRGG